MKTVVQLDAAGYFVGTTVADESPLEQGVYLMPAGTIDADSPVVPEGSRAKWDGGWVIEPMPQPEPEEPQPEEPTYSELRAVAYPDFRDYLDGVVKGDQDQINKYIADCLAVKAQYPKAQ